MCVCASVCKCICVYVQVCVHAHDFPCLLVFITLFPTVNSLLTGKHSLFIFALPRGTVNFQRNLWGTLTPLADLQRRKAAPAALRYPRTKSVHLCCAVRLHMERERQVGRTGSSSLGMGCPQ